MNLHQYLSKDGVSAKSLSICLGVSDVLISQWKTGVRQVPAERCPDIERATVGAVTCEELRPDLADQWAFLRGTEKPPAEDKPSSPTQKSEPTECASCPDRTKCEKRTGLVEPCELILKKRKSDWTD